MKRRLCSLVLAAALSIALAGQTLAVSLPTVSLNGEVLTMDTPAQVIGGTTYVAYWPIVKAFYPDAQIIEEVGTTTVLAEGLNVVFQTDVPYVIANGRYLYLPDGLRMVDGVGTLPVRFLGKILGLTVEWDAEVGGVLLTDAGTGPIKSAEAAYPEDVLYWLSHIISAESGNQPLEGQIAVGNVILNRVNSPLFPNTVYEVIHQKNQFTPVRTGSINAEPRALSVVAAKLALEGVNTAGSSLYFINPRVSGNSWVARNCTLVTTISAHAFYR